MPAYTKNTSCIHFNYKLSRYTIPKLYESIEKIRVIWIKTIEPNLLSMPIYTENTRCTDFISQRDIISKLYGNGRKGSMTYKMIIPSLILRYENRIARDQKGRRATR